MFLHALGCLYFTMTMLWETRNFRNDVIISFPWLLRYKIWTFMVSAMGYIMDDYSLIKRYLQKCVENWKITYKFPWMWKLNLHLRVRLCEKLKLSALLGSFFETKFLLSCRKTVIIFCQNIQFVVGASKHDQFMEWLPVFAWELFDWFSAIRIIVIGHKVITSHSYFASLLLL